MGALVASPWFWWGLALALLAAEALAPGAFMLWLGFAAAGTALIAMMTPMPVDAQWMLFAVLSLLSVLIGWQLRRRHPPGETDQPLLNRRGAQLVGQVHVLESAIVDGRGRMKIGDAYWTALGPDLPAGTRVRVLDADGGALRVDVAS
ncbi:MAG TPA: NfeD family protein [Xanthomonadaceae bacterium]|nr:NfeD family protein [Xanthomonadaceae bacterium]